MKTPLLISLLAGCLLTLPAQPLPAQEQPLQGKTSPQTADFVRYGNMPVSLYTGQVSVSVPLYHLQDPDFDLPLVLNYSADGLKPHKRPGWAGLNWSLGGTGVITREVYNAPDDYADYQYPGGVTYMGFWQAVQKRPYDPKELYNFNEEVVKVQGGTYALPTIDGKCGVQRARREGGLVGHDGAAHGRTPPTLADKADLAGRICLHLR